MPSEQPPTRVKWEITAVEKISDLLAVVPGRWTVTVEGWERPPHAGEIVAPLDPAPPSEQPREGEARGDLAARLKQEAMQIRASRDGTFSDGMAEGLERAASVAASTLTTYEQALEEIAERLPMGAFGTPISRAQAIARAALEGSKQ